MDFNVDQNIAFIRSRLPEHAQSLSDDAILSVLDIICDYDSENDIFDICVDLDDDFDASDAAYRAALVEYVKNTAAKRRIPGLSPEIAEHIVVAELDYEDTIADL